MTARIATCVGRGEKGRRPRPIVPLRGQLVPAQEERDHDQEEGEGLLDPGHRPGSRVREPVLRSEEPQPRLGHRDPERGPVVTQNELKLPSNAAASAGTIRSVTVNGSMKLLIDAARMPNAPVSTVDRTQLVPASTVGREPEEDGTLLVLGRGPGGEAEAREPEHRPEHGGHGHDDDGQDQVVDRDHHVDRGRSPGACA